MTCNHRSFIEKPSEAGKSIYIVGATGAGVTQDVEVLRQKIAGEVSKPVRVIEVVDLPEIAITSQH